MRSFLLATLLLFSWPYLVHGKLTQAECADVDYSDKLGPVRNQGSSMSCFALAAADLITFNQKLSVEDRVSGLDVHLNFLQKTKAEDIQSQMDSQKDWDSSLTIAKTFLPFLQKKDSSRFGKSLLEKFKMGGDLISPVLKYNTSGGICREANLPSQTPQAFAGAKDYILKAVESMGNNTAKTNKLFDAQNFCAKESPFSTLQSSAEAINEQTSQQSISLMREACRERIAIKPMMPFFHFFEKEDQEKASSIIAKILEVAPVGIGYDLDFLTNGAQHTDALYNHASSIVGMRWNKELNTCEFKIRNSYGLNCESYHQDYRDSCKGGNIWINEQTANRRIQAVIAIEPQK